MMKIDVIACCVTVPVSAVFPCTTAGGAPPGFEMMRPVARSGKLMRLGGAWHGFWMKGFGALTRFD